MTTNTRYTLYLVDGEHHFLQKGSSLQILQASKKTVQLWINQMQVPQPSKEAELIIVASPGGEVARTTFSGNRLRWKNAPMTQEPIREAPQSQVLAQILRR